MLTISDAVLIVRPDNLAEALRVPGAHAVAPRNLDALATALRQGLVRSGTHRS